MILYKDINFKIAIISCLHKNSYYITEANNIRLIANKKLKYQSLLYDDIVPEVFEFYKNVDIDSESLNTITEFNPSASNHCYNLLVKEWSGEDDIFNIKSLDGIENLTMMETFNPFGLLDFDIDIQALLNCKKLHTLYQKFIPNTEYTKQIVRQLSINGVKIIE